MPTGAWVKEIIQGQHQSWAAAQANAQGLIDPGNMMVVGSGTSYYLAQVAAEFGLRHGLKIQSRPCEDLVLEPDLYLAGISTLVVISRSGTTSEAVWAVESGRSRGIHTIGVTCQASSPLASSCDQALVSPEGEDDTVVMIRSFSSMLLLLQRSLGPSAGHDLGSHAPSVWQETEDAVASWSTPPRRLYLLGSGVRTGITKEGALKAQEMSGGAAYGYSPLEFRHGPRGSVTAEDLVVLLGQTAYAPYEWDVIEDLWEQGPQIWVVARPSWFEARRDRVHMVHQKITLPEIIPDVEAGPLAIIPLQWLAWHLSVANGRDPDHPQNLTRVVSIRRG